MHGNLHALVQMFMASGVSMFWSMEIALVLFFFQAEDGIRDAQESRGLGDVYKRQILAAGFFLTSLVLTWLAGYERRPAAVITAPTTQQLSLIHI